MKTADQIIRERFKELTLGVGGIVATSDVPDAAVWDLCRLIDLTMRRIIAGVCEAEGHSPGPLAPRDTPHPAICHLLDMTGRRG